MSFQRLGFIQIRKSKLRAYPLESMRGQPCAVILTLRTVVSVTRAGQVKPCAVPPGTPVSLGGHAPRPPPSLVVVKAAFLLREVCVLPPMSLESLGLAARSCRRQPVPQFWPGLGEEKCRLIYIKRRADDSETTVDGCSNASVEL